MTDGPRDQVQEGGGAVARPETQPQSQVRPRRSADADATASPRPPPDVRVPGAVGTDPALSIVLVTLGGIAELAIPLPGLCGQTIAHRIELILVAARGRVSPEDLAGIGGLHSVRLVELATITSRSADALAGIAVARAPFCGYHENHTRAAPETYARCLAALDGDTSVGAVSPMFHAANPEMVWGLAMFAAAHAHAAPPALPGPRPLLVLHQAVYRTDFLHAQGDGLAAEARAQAALTSAGLTMMLVPDTVIWHLNEARPARVLADVKMLGRSFGFHRSRDWSGAQRLGRAAALPAIAGLAVLRLVGAAARTPEARPRLWTALPALALSGLAFGVGEVRGYFDRKNPFTQAYELHEFHVRGRLAGRRPAMRWLRDALDRIPEDAP